MIFAIFCFTLLDAQAKGLVGNYSAVQVAWARYAGQTILVALLIIRQLGPMLRTRFPGLQLLRSGFQLTATLLFFSSLSFIGLAEATTIVDLNPVLITLGAALFLGEKIGLRRFLGVAVALLGAMIIIRPGVGVFSPGAFLALGCGVCYTGYSLVTRAVGNRESVWTSLLYTGLFGTVMLSGLLPWVWQPMALADLPGFAAVGALGAVAQLCLIRALMLAEASVVAPFSYLGLVYALVWGWLFFDEWPDGWTLLGALVIVLAGLYVWHREARQRGRAQ